MVCRYFPPNGGGISAPFDDRNLIANGELSDVVQLRLAQTLTFERHQADGQTRGIELQHHRGQGSGRQALQVGQGQVGQLGDIGIGVRSRLKVHADDAHAQQASVIPCGRCRRPW